MVMHALIDGDICIHRVGFTTENDEFWVAKARLDDMLDKILLDTQVESFDIYLSDSAVNNFRYSVYPLYKANRIGKPRPKHLEGLKEYLLTKWGAKFSEGMEADDALGIGQDEENPTTVICSIDKDLKQIPGLHYNFVKEEWDDVSREKAVKEFYKSIIVGDVSDNIPGAYGMGPVKASKAIDSPVLNDLTSDELERKCMEAVIILWQTSLAKEWGLPWTKDKGAAMLGMILMSGRLLKIRRSLNEPLWDFPSSDQIKDYLSLYTQLPAVVSDQFTAPIMPETSTDGSQFPGVQTDDISPQSSPAQ